MSHLPSTQQLYLVPKKEGIEQLTLHKDEPIPQPNRNQVLVQLKAYSLNFRDLMVINGHYPSPIENISRPKGFIPLSDASGQVVAIGEDVKEFSIGDRVSGLFHPDWMDGKHDTPQRGHSLGAGDASSEGVLSQLRIFEKHSLVKIPSYLSYEEASTLPCAAFTAYHALFQNIENKVDATQMVLVLGTGGVSMFALQFAKTAGARVIVTSSSDEKLKRVSRNLEWILQFITKQIQIGTRRCESSLQEEVSIM
ncbi:hypothetical protein FDP41_009717 [Naegleria fowleri]|uniref:Enoyl reductase (ER) domain-containing protein n=1 Tax=Naegleria fowleri TaxID=5763 RepID=A0A6A5BB03_NAEFO|nr:uncharacterized protein FDP41_009717 [Naegleria fowleri]KAF0972021.1 hypothetical protein FDP41_009717 [Naegleria fowleri]